MKRYILLAAGLAATGSAALATEYGTVVASSAVITVSPVPQRACADRQLVAPADGEPAALAARGCSTVTGYHGSVAGYDVIYEYKGKRYTARVARDPGEHIALTVSPGEKPAPEGAAVPVVPAPDR